MSKQAMTPGPWELRRDIPCSTQGWVVYSGRGEKNKTVVRMSYGRCIPPVPSAGSIENEANAHAIAAIPDMIDALKRMECAFSDLPSDYVENWQDRVSAIEAARTALRKAGVAE